MMINFKYLYKGEKIMKNYSTNREILGIRGKKTVTLAFIDVEVNGKLFHKNFYCGPEKSVCLSETYGVYLVSITKKKSGFDELYECVNTVVQMIKYVLEKDLSLYNKQYLTLEMYDKYFD